MGNGMSNSDSDSDPHSKRNFWNCDDDCDSDHCLETSRRCRSHSPDSKKKQSRLEFKLKYNDESDDDEEDSDVQKLCIWSTSDYGSYIKIKSCDWTISDFNNSEIHTKGTIRSDVYVAGAFNQFQFYFVMDKLEAPKGTFFGVYINVLSNIRSNATVKYWSYLTDYRNRELNLSPASDQKFPRKAGFRFLGSMFKDVLYLEDEQCYGERYVPDGDMNLVFKMRIEYKTFAPLFEFKQLLDNNKTNDITLIVKGIEFPANKKILMERSPAFTKLLAKQSGTKKLVIDDVDPDIMKQILKFIYTGRVTKLFSIKEELKSAAEKYQLKDLKDICKKIKSS